MDDKPWFERPSSPYDATPEQLEALWDVADAAKTVMSFLHGFVKRRAHTRELKHAIPKLGNALEALTRITNLLRTE